jgi:hypothetical protein
MVIALFITDNKMAETLKAYAHQYGFLTLYEIAIMHVRFLM